ncbi:MAG: hypothetical protein IPJ65_23010 [Archangiaceae bacterium]|nr:hypothetical protein [Archangiaceae bacterium]
MAFGDMFKKKLGDAAALPELTFERRPPPEPRRKPRPVVEEEPALSQPEAPPSEPEPAASEPEPAASKPEAAPSEPEAAPPESEPAPSESEPAPSESEAAPSESEAAPSEPEAAAPSGLLDAVEGVTLEQYATVQARRAKLNSSEALTALLAEFGMDEAKWSQVDQVFMARMSDASDPMATAAFATEYEKFYAAANA